MKQFLITLCAILAAAAIIWGFIAVRNDILVREDREATEKNAELSAQLSGYTNAAEMKNAQWWAEQKAQQKEKEERREYETESERLRKELDQSTETLNAEMRKIDPNWKP